MEFNLFYTCFRFNAYIDTVVSCLPVCWATFLKLFMTISLHQQVSLLSWRLTPAAKSITFPDVFYLYVSNHFIRAFQMLDVGLMSPSLSVCLSAFLLRPSFSVWVFVSVFRPLPAPSAQSRQPWLQSCTEHRCWNCQKLFCGVEMKFDQIEGRLLWWKDWMGS